MQKQSIYLPYSYRFPGRSEAVDGYQKARLCAERSWVQGDGHFPLSVYIRFLIFLGQDRANNYFVHFYWYLNFY
jgi:hypothetical protein